MKKKILLLFLTIFAAFAIVACNDETVELTLGSTTAQLEIGQSQEIAVTVSDDMVDKLQVSSSNSDVVTASITGKTLKVVGVSAGSAVVTVTVEGTEESARLNVSVKAVESGAKFTGHTQVFFIDVGNPLETEIKEATQGIKAFDDDGSEIATEITISGIETIDVSAAVGTRYQLEISVEKADGTLLTAIITVEIFGESVDERVVIFGPNRLTYYIGSDQNGFAMEKEFSATNLNTKEAVDIEVEYTLGKDITLQTPGKHSVIITAEDGLISATKTVELFVKQAVTIKDELRGTTAANPITISFGHGNGHDIEALFNKYATSFKAQMLDEGVHVEVSIDKLGANYDEVRDAVTSAMQTGTEIPNIIQNYPDHLAEYQGYGKIISLTPYVFHPVWGFDQSNNLDSFYDIVQSYRDEQRAASLEGDILSMPFNKSTEFVIYNKDMFDEVLQGKAFPETWEELIALAPALRGQIDANIARIANAYSSAGNSTYTADAQKAAKDEFYPFSYDSAGNAFITLTKAWGGQYTSQTGTREDKLLFVNDQTRQMLRFFGDNRSEFTSPAVWNNASYATDLFLKGYSAFSVSSTAGADKNTPLVGNTKLFNIGVAPMLYSRLYPEYRNVIQQGTNFAITTEGDADQKIVSWLFLKFLNSQETSLDYAFEKGYFPTRYSTLEHQDYQEFLELANKPIITGMVKAEADRIMRAKAAQIYFEQRDFMVFDLPFKGSSGVRGKVETAFKDVVLALPTADITATINNALTNAYNESLRLVSDD